MAIYCYLSNPILFEDAVAAAVFIRGDTDTIASMTGAISGAALGESQIPKRWLLRVTEPAYKPNKVRQIAFDLYEAGRRNSFKTK